LSLATNGYNDTVFRGEELGSHPRD